MSEKKLHSAIRSEKLSTKQGFLQKLFAVWFDGFIYNQIWEDPRVDLEALQLDERSRVLAISSGGCNALNYLLAGPASVSAVDLNRHHIYLLDLKAAALRHLPAHENFFDFFGRGKSRNAGSSYLKFVAPHLSKGARNFWESNTIVGSLLFGDRISFFSNAGLYEHSRNAYFLRLFHKVAQLAGCEPERLLSANSADEREALFRQHIDPFFSTIFVRAVGKLPLTVFGLGIPPQQFNELKAELRAGGTVIDIYRERVRRLACDFPIEDNYFAWQAFGRKYDTVRRKAIPEYLKEENYEILKANIDRLTTAIDSVTDVIENDPIGAFNRIVLLDAQDWMNAEQITRLWSAIADRAEPGSRIIFRTAAADSPIERSLPAELRSKFRYEKVLSEVLFRQDRASIYGGFHLYVLEK